MQFICGLASLQKSGIFVALLVCEVLYSNLLFLVNHEIERLLFGEQSSQFQCRQRLSVFSFFSHLLASAPLLARVFPCSPGCLELEILLPHLLRAVLASFILSMQDGCSLSLFCLLGYNGTLFFFFSLCGPFPLLWIEVSVGSYFSSVPLFLYALNFSSNNCPECSTHTWQLKKCSQHFKYSDSIPQ